MGSGKYFFQVVGILQVALCAGAIQASAFDHLVIGWGADGAVLTARTHPVAEGFPGRVNLPPVSIPEEDAAPTVLPTPSSGPQTGWPISNGSGMESGFGGAPTYADLDRDGDLELVVGSRDAKVYAWHHDGTTVAGWPFTTQSYVISHVAVADINNDQYPEVVFSSNDGYLYAVSHDGVVMDGWPKLLDRQWPHTGGAYYQASPVLADLDGDGFLDIIFNSNEYSSTHAFNYLGQDLPGWPVAWARPEFNSFFPAVGDLDGDGSLEVVTGTLFVDGGGTINLNRIYAWHGDGTPVTGWPVDLEDHWWSPFWSMAIADIDADLALDVIATDTMHVYVLHGDGSPHLGWPYEGVYTDLDHRRTAIANLDDDKQLEIVSNYLNGMLVLDDDGSLMSIFPISQVDPDQPAIADLDNDGSNEVVTVGDYPENSVFAWNADGSLVDGFPVVTPSYVDATPLIVDIDGDGDLEIAIGEYGSSTAANQFYVWDLDHLENPSLLEWPMFQHDPRNTGHYSAPCIFCDGFETGSTGVWSVTVP